MHLKQRIVAVREGSDFGEDFQDARIEISGVWVAHQTLSLVVVGQDLDSNDKPRSFMIFEIGKRKDELIVVCQSEFQHTILDTHLVVRHGELLSEKQLRTD
jgi:hypothetical protein